MSEIKIWLPICNELGILIPEISHCYLYLNQHARSWGIFDEKQKILKCSPSSGRHQKYRTVESLMCFGNLLISSFRICRFQPAQTIPSTPKMRLKIGIGTIKTDCVCQTGGVVALRQPFFSWQYIFGLRVDSLSNQTFLKQSNFFFNKKDS